LTAAEDAGNPPLLNIPAPDAPAALPLTVVNGAGDLPLPGILIPDPPAEPPVPVLSPLAVVDGVALTREDLMDELLRRHGAATLAELVDFRLIRAALAERGLAVADGEVDAALAERFQRRGGEAATLIAAGLDRAAYRVRVVWLELALRRLVMADRPATDEALSAYLEANEALFAEPERARVFHVLASPSTAAETAPEKAWTAGPEEWEAARLRAESWLREIRTGTEFGALARRVSDDPQTKAQDGEIGWVERGRLLREVEMTAFLLEPGEIAGPVRSLVGYHIVRVGERREGGCPGLSDVRERGLAAYEEERCHRHAAETLAGLRAAAEREGRLSFPAATGIVPAGGAPASVDD